MPDSYESDAEKAYPFILFLHGMGGFGTWDFASRYPHWFAAIAPICGGGDALRIRRLKEMPVWAFHGMKDRVVPIERTLGLVPGT
jgi:predicted peptidase